MSQETVLTPEVIGEMLSAKQYSRLAAELASYMPQDTALLMDELEPREMIRVYRLMSKDLAAETFVSLDVDTQKTLINAFSDAELREVVSELYVDDTVDILEEMPANLVHRILANTAPDIRRAINEILKYPENSAGSIMTVEFINLSRSMTVSEAFDKIRKTGVDKETVYTCYVTDKNRHLEAVVTVQSMLLCDPGATVESVMDENVISCRTTDDREDVANMLKKYDFLALPVVDGENRLVGIVTIDDAIDVLTDETTADMEMMAAILPSEKPYLKTGVFETCKQRIPWLLFLMLSATFTAAIITRAEEALATHVVLTAFIPMLMGTGGNASGQSSVTVIRGLSLGEVTFGDWLRVLWKELRVSLLCGVILSTVNFAKVILFDRLSVQIAAVISLTLLLVVALAKSIGCLLPIAAKRLGFDPAVMASPFITTLVDALALAAYFAIAQAMLPM